MVQHLSRGFQILRQPFHEKGLFGEILPKQETLISFKLIQKMECKDGDFQFRNVLNTGEDLLKELGGDDFDPAAEAGKDLLHGILRS